ncbi:uncharacterized protein LOC135622011 [Musa acuminata AAA Group]|uniref:uncharacterized protein LOC135622011 n=1 Tax=Musa acuminata AAA Group TaxID=214697 RepID=UPI0031DA4847
MGLKPSRFFWSLIEKPPVTVSEMLQHANQYVTAEALVVGKRMEGKRPRVEQPRGSTSATLVPPRRGLDRQELLLRPSPLPLKASRTEIVLQIREKDYGHDTEDCHDLQNQIEGLIRRGYLGRYLKEPREATPSPKELVERQIDVISGGLAASDNSSAARKAYARSMVKKHPQPEIEPEITFGAREVEHSHHDDALVISIQVANAQVKRVMVDTGSYADVLYFDTFRRLSLTKGDLTPMVSALTGFTGDSISPLGTMALPVTIGEEPRVKTMITTFMVVDLLLAYNIILGRSTLNKLKAVVSTYHRAVKFPTSEGIGEARSDPGESRRCYLAAVTLPGKSHLAQVPNPREGPTTPMLLEPLEWLIEVSLKKSRPDQTVKVGTALPEVDQLHLIDFLRRNADMFA